MFRLILKKDEIAMLYDLLQREEENNRDGVGPEDELTFVLRMQKTIREMVYPTTAGTDTGESELLQLEGGE